MKRLLVLSSLSLFFILSSCGTSPQEENKALRDSVIAVHDEVMPLMSKLKSMEAKAVKTAEDLEATENPDMQKVDELKALAYDLNQAYEGMFVWMRQYEQEDGDRSPEKVKAYLEGQMLKVEVVNEEITSVLSRAEELLEN